MKAFDDLEKEAMNTAKRVESATPLLEIMVPNDGQWWTVHLRVKQNAEGEFLIDNVWSDSDKEE